MDVIIQFEELKMIFFKIEMLHASYVKPKSLLVATEIIMS